MGRKGVAQHIKNKAFVEGYTQAMIDTQRGYTNKPGEHNNYDALDKQQQKEITAEFNRIAEKLYTAWKEGGNNGKNKNSL